MEDRVHTPRLHAEGLYRPDQPRAAGIYDEVGPAPVAPRLPEESPGGPAD